MVVIRGHVSSKYSQGNAETHKEEVSLLLFWLFIPRLQQLLRDSVYDLLF
jgi:hypothetical protein